MTDAGLKPEVLIYDQTLIEGEARPWLASAYHQTAIWIVNASGTKSAATANKRLGARIGLHGRSFIMNGFMT